MVTRAAALLVLVELLVLRALAGVSTILLLTAPPSSRQAPVPVHVQYYGRTMGHTRCRTAMMEQRCCRTAAQHTQNEKSRCRTERDHHRCTKTTVHHVLESARKLKNLGLARQGGRGFPFLRESNASCERSNRALIQISIGESESPREKIGISVACASCAFGSWAVREGRDTCLESSRRYSGPQVRFFFFFLSYQSPAEPTNRHGQQKGLLAAIESFERWYHTSDNYNVL